MKSFDCLTVVFPEGYLKLILYTDNTRKSIAIVTNGRNEYGQSSYAILACPGYPRDCGGSRQTREPPQPEQRGSMIKMCGSTTRKHLNILYMLINSKFASPNKYLILLPLQLVARKLTKIFRNAAMRDLKPNFVHFSKHRD